MQSQDPQGSENITSCKRAGEGEGERERKKRIKAKLNFHN
jgi:hypothetical protein